MRTAGLIRTAFTGMTLLPLLTTASRGAAAQATGGTSRTTTAGGRFSVTPVLGYMHWDNASALANKKADGQGGFTKTATTDNLTFGLSADYHVVPALGVGFYFEAARPTTRGDYFPSALFNFGANLPAELSVVSQRVTVLMYGVEGTFRFGVGRLQPYVGAGAGAVTVNADPQQSNANASFTHPSFQVGGGLGWRTSENTALTLDVRDYVFTSWNREQLNAVDPSFQNTIFPAANGNPPAAKSTLNNIRLALGFTFVPKRGGDAPVNTGEQE
jgi:opacity protein-like surface antigen